MSGHLLFVCTGNTCRSPLAEAIARQLLAERALDVSVASAGTVAGEGAPASDGSILVGLERKFDLSTHRSRALTPEMVTEATLILAMAPHHAARVREFGGDGKVFLLSDYAAREETARAITDPFGGELDAYRRMADELQTALPRVIDRLADEQPAQGRA